MENEVKQSYNEQPNPPTNVDETTDEVMSEDATRTAWVCTTPEVGYGDYTTSVSLQDKLDDIDATVAGKANATHNQSASTITGLATVATSGLYADLEGSPTSLPANGGNADTVDNKHASDFATASHTHTQYASTSHSHAQNDITGLADALSGKANTNHTHNYAAATHTHTLDSISETTTKKVMTATEREKLSGIAENANNYTHPASHAASMITGLATVATSGKYADLSGKPTSMTPTAHTHAQSDVTGLATALSEKADTEHTHEQSDITGLATALAGKAASNHTHGAVTASANGMMIAADKQKLDGIATGANKTVVDSALSSTSTNPVQNKVINNALYGKANSSHTHAQSDVTGLENALNGKANTTHTHAQSDVTGLSDALAGKANTDHTHILYHSTQTVSSYKLIYLATNGNDNNNGFSQSTPMKTIKGTLKKYADKYKFLDLRLADGTYTEDIGTVAIDQCNLSIRSISEDKDKVTLNMQTTMELSVCEMRMYNMTINVPITGVRAISINAGVFYAYAVRFNVPTNSNSSCINVYNGSSAFLMNCILNSGTGSSTGACIYGNQAMMIKAINCTSERTVAIAFYAHNGTEIIYSDTITATTKTKETYYGKCTVRAANPNTILWTGVLFMNANHTITPTKKLSDCQNGWILLWSDYDEDGKAAQDADFVTTMIPKKKPNGGTWDGKTFHCDVPRYYGSNTNDVDTERRVIKTLYIYNDKIVGHVVNDKDERTDVVLRAVYEY